MGLALTSPSSRVHHKAANCKEALTPLLVSLDVYKESCPNPLVVSESVQDRIMALVGTGVKGESTMLTASLQARHMACSNRHGWSAIDGFPSAGFRKRVFD